MLGISASGIPKRHRGARAYCQFGRQIGRQSLHATATGAGTIAGAATVFAAAFTDSEIVGTALASPLPTCLGVAVSH